MNNSLTPAAIPAWVGNGNQAINFHWPNAIANANANGCLQLLGRRREDIVFVVSQRSLITLNASCRYSLVDFK